MTLSDIKTRIMFQTNNDASDVGDYLPHLVDYINEGYALLLYAWAGVYPAPAHDAYPTLDADTDTPVTPEWTHNAIADYGTWLVYRNGNASKQQRGMRYLAAFEDVKARIYAFGGKDATGAVRNFKNIPW